MAAILHTWHPAEVHGDPGLYEALRGLLAAHDLDTEDVFKTELHLNTEDWSLFLRVHRYAPRANGERQRDPHTAFALLTVPPVDLPALPEGKEG